MSFEAVKTYSNKTAKEHDISRFENTYGDFIDRQERAYLKKNLSKQGSILYLGCGTGRFMEYSTIGLDFSDEMLAVAKENFPNKKYITQPAHLTSMNLQQKTGQKVKRHF